jgi:hypothetical protein
MRRSRNVQASDHCRVDFDQHLQFCGAKRPGGHSVSCHLRCGPSLPPLEQTPINRSWSGSEAPAREPARPAARAWLLDVVVSRPAARASWQGLEAWPLAALPSRRGRAATLQPSEPPLWGDGAPLAWEVLRLRGRSGRGYGGPTTGQSSLASRWAPSSPQPRFLPRPRLSCAGTGRIRQTRAAIGTTANSGGADWANTVRRPQTAAQVFRRECLSSEEFDVELGWPNG